MATLQTIVLSIIVLVLYRVIKGRHRTLETKVESQNNNRSSIYNFINATPPKQREDNRTNYPYQIGGTSIAIEKYNNNMRMKTWLERLERVLKTRYPANSWTTETL